MTRFLPIAALTLTLAACEPAEAPAEAELTTTAEVDAVAGPAAVSPAASAEVGPFNLNTATSEEFATIPGVGDRMVHEFEEYRPYTSIQQFRREIGKYVDEEQVAAYEPYVFVPVDPDASDEATLAQLPGVGAEEAAALVAGRPYGSAEAFLTAYAEAVPAGDADAARVYLGQ